LDVEEGAGAVAELEDVVKEPAPVKEGEWP
jgi:hypothetical protein